MMWRLLGVTICALPPCSPLRPRRPPRFLFAWRWESTAEDAEDAGKHRNRMLPTRTWL